MRRSPGSKFMQNNAPARELLTPDEMARVDAASPGLGVPGYRLMENAGGAVARAIQARIRPCRTLVLCGPGNNGGDGYVVARLLAQQGWPVAVAALGAPRAGSDAALAKTRWHGVNVAFTQQEATRADLVIDAVFGAGLSRDLDPGLIDVLRAARRLVAVDVPSGVDGATGAVRGFAAQATLTVTFFRLKPGHLLLPGRDLCGETVLADIGMPAGCARTLPFIHALFRNEPGLWQHVAGPGHRCARTNTLAAMSPLWVVAEMTGAARLAADAARRAGAWPCNDRRAWGGRTIYRAGAPGTLVSEAPLADLLADHRRTALGLRPWAWAMAVVTEDFGRG